MSDSTDALEHQDPADIAGVTDEYVEEETAAGHQAEQGENGEVPPSEPSGPDLSFLDDDVKDTLAAVSERPLTEEEMASLAEGLKRGHLRHADYTRKRQKESKELKDALALSESGQKWQALMNDPGLQQHILAYQQGGVPQQAEPEEDLSDLFTKDPDEFVRVIESRVERKFVPLIERAREEAKREALEEVQGPTRFVNSLAQAAEDWSGENGVDAEVVAEACASMRGDLGLERLTPELVVSLLPRYTTLVQAEKQKSAATEAAQSKSRLLDQARAASPRGGVGATSADAVPIREIIAKKEKAAGRQLTIEERANLVFDQVLTEQGKSERELDEEYRRAFNK